MCVIIIICPVHWLGRPWVWVCMFGPVHWLVGWFSGVSTRWCCCCCCVCVFYLEDVGSQVPVAPLRVRGQRQVRRVCFSFDFDGERRKRSVIPAACTQAQGTPRPVVPAGHRCPFPSQSHALTTVRLRHRLVDCAPGHVENVPHLQRRLQDGRADGVLCCMWG